MSPLVPIAIGWLAGLWSGLALGPQWPAASALAPVTLGIGTWLGLATRFVSPRAWLSPTLSLVAVLAGFTTGSIPGPRAHPPPVGLARFEGRVLRAHSLADGRHRALVEVRQGQRVSDHRSIAAGSLLWVGPHALPPGAQVRVLAKVKPHTWFRNPSPHPAWPRTHVDGHAFAASRSATRILSISPQARLTYQLRGRLRAALDRSLSPRRAGVARALLLGERAQLSQHVLAVVAEAGLAHVLAVSGLHITLLAGTLLLGLRAALRCLPRLTRRLQTDRLAYAIGVPLAFALAELCGDGPSARRAATTAAIAWGLGALGRRPDAAAVASTAAILMTAAEPDNAASVGLVLSIVATAAIVSAAPERGTEGNRGSGGTLRAALMISLRTTIATAPMVLWCFGRVPLAGVLTNLVGVPLVGLAVLPLCALHAVAETLVPGGAPFSASIAGTAIDALLGLCALGAALPLTLSPPPPTLLQGCVMAGGCLALLLTRRWRTRLMLAAACGLVIALGEWHVRATQRPLGQLRVTFLDVGQGDAALVDLPDGRLMLIDAGGDPAGYRDPGRHVLAPLLRARRRDHIDVAVLSHPHPDHYGGLPAVAQAVTIGQLWDTGQAQGEADMTPTAGAASTLIGDLRKRGTRIRAPKHLCEHPQDLGGALVEVLWPCPGYDPGYGANDNSLVLRVTFGRHRFLFTGDVEAHGEAQLLAFDLRADVLKVPHHGSRTSSSRAFLRAVAADVAIVSSGAHNRFGHPHPEVRQRLHASGAKVIELAEQGGTVIVTDGREMELETWAGRRFAITSPPARRRHRESTTQRPQ